MRTSTTFSHIAALALAAASLLSPDISSAAPTSSSVTTSTSTSIKLPDVTIATKTPVQVRGVSQPNLKPNICDVNPKAFKGCKVF